MKNCCNCGYGFCDMSVNELECENKDITEDELQDYFTDDKPNCSYWKESKKQSKALTIEQVNKMFEAIENNR